MGIIALMLVLISIITVNLIITLVHFRWANS